MPVQFLNCRRAYPIDPLPDRSAAAEPDRLILAADSDRAQIPVSSAPQNRLDFALQLGALCPTSASSRTNWMRHPRPWCRTLPTRLALFAMSSLEDADVVHLSPARHEHINPYGKYPFNIDEAQKQGRLRPLRKQ